MIIDANVDITSDLPALVAAGLKTFIGYLDPLGQASKVVTPARARAIGNAKVRLGLVSEGWGDFAHGGISAGAGQRDAENALTALPLLGAPEGACVYFAVDTDASQAQVQKIVLPYFQSIESVFAGSKYRWGVYGSGLVCSSVNTPMTWLSCSMGWTNSKDYLASGKWVLRQHVPSVVAGVPCDVDDQNPAVADIGDFVPFYEPPLPADV